MWFLGYIKKLWCRCEAFYKNKYTRHLRNRIKDTFNLVFWLIGFVTMASAVLAILLSGVTKMTEAQSAYFAAYFNNTVLIVLFWMVLGILLIGVTYSFVDAFVRWIKGMRVPSTTDIETRVGNLESAAISLDNRIQTVERTINQIAKDIKEIKGKLNS